MKIEKLRKNHKKEIIIGTILIVVIGGALTYRLTHSKYRVTQSIDLGSGVINYKVPDFKIMAMYQQKDGSTCTNDSCYNEITTMPTSGYVINEDKTYCRTSSGNEVKGKIKTVNGIHGISGLNKGDKCYLYFDVNKNITIGDNEFEYKTEIPNFSSKATTDEGVYATSDGMYGGATYYWRGAATTNHVIFANKCWRIIRINGDKTMRLIYNGSIQSGNTCTGKGSYADDSIAVASQAYNSSIDQSNYVGWTYSGTSQRTTGGTDSNAKTQTQTWYDNNIGNNVTYNSKVADGKFCNDRNVKSGQSWVLTGTTFKYAAYERLVDNKTPTFSCPSGDIYTLKAGAITADEVVFAGGKNDANYDYYLYNGKGYWTMSPDGGTGREFAVFYVDSYGQSYGCVVGASLGLRPVINLKANTKFASGGTGTQSNPYTVQ